MMFTDADVKRLALALKQQLFDELLDDMEKRMRDLMESKEPCSSEDVANHLGIPLRRWQEMYRSNPKLRRAGLPVGTRGEGEEYKWDLAAVKKVLRKK